MNSPTLKANHVVRGFKLFGLQRTCTNFMLRAMLDSFLVESLERGWEWKHGPIGPVAEHRHNGRPALVVVCVRNPYAWMESCFRYFAGHPGDTSHCPNFRSSWEFATFVTSAHYQFENPVDRWNRVNRAYLDWLARHPTQGTLVRSEDLMSPAMQLRRLEQIEAQFDLTRRAPRIHAFKRRIDGLARQTDAPMRFSYFQNEEYLETYDTRLFHFVNQRIDRALMRELGYVLRNADR